MIQTANFTVEKKTYGQGRHYLRVRSGCAEWTMFPHGTGYVFADSSKPNAEGKSYPVPYIAPEYRDELAQACNDAGRSQ